MPMDRDLLLRTMLDIVQHGTPNTLAEILRSRAMLGSAADEVARVIRLYWNIQKDDKQISDIGGIVDIPSEFPGDELSDVEAFAVEITLDVLPVRLATVLDALTALDGPRATELAAAVKKRGVQLAKKAS